MGKSLIIVRAGRKSLHHGWIDYGRTRNWDLYVCPFEAIPFQSDPSAQIIVGEVIPGPKWSGLSQLFRTYENWRDYEFIMLADDDLFALPSVWERYFEMITEQRPLISQPALSSESYFSHLITCQNSHFCFRETNFIEIMMPCFRTDIFEAIIPTFDLSRTGWGWGLDFLWSHMLSNKGMIIVDDTPVIHTRPPGSMTDLVLKQKLHAEMMDILAIITTPNMPKTLSGLNKDGRILNEQDADFLRLYMGGYWDKIKDNPAYFSNLLKPYLAETSDK